ncbi:replication initiator protein A [Deinococcus aquaticus]|uniref:replication initiator protein A n=1 Tax=Deinococcus aquaticus TaxID=328692 RepID=UPI003F48BF06
MQEKEVVLPQPEKLTKLPTGIKHIERNLARLNLILSVKQTDQTHWQKSLELDDHGVIRIECTAAAGDVVPHGTDNDVLLGLVTAAVIQGVPGDDTVNVTLVELLRLSGLQPSARAYTEVRESLRRLQRTSYEIRDSWFDRGHVKWHSVTMSVVARIQVNGIAVTAESAGRWQAHTQVTVQLDRTVMQSVRAGYLRAVDRQILDRLRQPMTRNVFITLSVLRLQDDENSAGTYRVPLMRWGAHLGLHWDRPDRVLRALAPVHESLKHAGVLAAVQVEGRGAAQILTYQFHPPTPAALDIPEAGGKPRATRGRDDPGSLSGEPQFDAHAVTLLTVEGVAPGRAVKLARQFTLAQIEVAVGTLAALRATPYRERVANPAGLLLDILAHPDRYVLPGAAGRPSTPAVPPGVGTVKQEPMTRNTRQPASPEPPPDVERTASAALTLLSRRLDATTDGRAVRDEAVEAFIAGLVGALDLIKIGKAATVPEARVLLERLRTRQEHPP